MKAEEMIIEAQVGFKIQGVLHIEMDIAISPMTEKKVAKVVKAHKAILGKYKLNVPDSNTHIQSFLVPEENAQAFTNEILDI